jgi:hypothetical protein
MPDQDAPHERIERQKRDPGGHRQNPRDDFDVGPLDSPPPIHDAQGCVEDPEVVTQTGRAGRVDGAPQIWIVDEAEAKQY